MHKLALAIAFAAAGMAATATDAQIVPHIGSVIALGAKFCPEDWLPADGKVVPIAEYEQLFSVIGTKYGGDGQNTFGLPKLTGGTFGPAKPPLTWCIAYAGRSPLPMNQPPKHK